MGIDVIYCLDLKCVHDKADCCLKCDEFEYCKDACDQFDCEIWKELNGND